MIPLDDGTYDVVVLDARPDAGATTRFELVLLNGRQQGDVVELVAHHLDGDPLTWLGLPGTLTVSAGVPALSIDER